MSGVDEKTPLNLSPAESGASDSREKRCRACGVVPVRERSTAVLLTLSLIFLVMTLKEACNNALPTVLPDLRKDSGDRRVVSLLPGIGSGGYAVGKFTQIPVTYLLGGRWCLTASAALGGVSMLLFTLGGFELQVLGWFGAQVAVAHFWGGATRLVGNWVDGEFHGRVYAIAFGLSADAGGALVAAAYGVLLDAGYGWRMPFFLCGVALSVLSAALLLSLPESAESAGFRPPIEKKREDGQVAHPLTGVPLATAARVFLVSARCWLQVVACCGFSVSWGAVTTYAPMYASARLGANDGAAADMLTFGGFGATLGALGGGFLRDSLSGSHMLRVSVGFKVFSMLVAVSWILLDADLFPHVSLTTGILAGMIFVIMASIEYSWNVLVSVFSLRYGGPTHSSTLVGVMDMVSFIVVVPFIFDEGILIEEDDFTAALLLITGSLVVGHACMIAFLHLDRHLAGAHEPPKDDVGGKAS